MRLVALICTTPRHMDVVSIEVETSFAHWLPDNLLLRQFFHGDLAFQADIVRIHICKPANSK